MNEYFSDRRKIAPARKPDGTPDDNDRVEIGPTQLAFEEWAAAGLVPPDMASLRSYRLDRLVDQVVRNEVAGLLLFDPLNIRYATDSTNMQLWNTHNPFRACLVCPDGYMVLWDYKNSPFLSQFNPLVREVLPGASMFYMVSGDKTGQDASDFTSQLLEILVRHAGSNRRIAVDKIQISGLRALEGSGLEVLEGEPLSEKARAVKGPEEILAMRCAIHSCEQSVAVMERAASPGMSEDEIWAVLHAENIKRGGEWIETRLLTSGPRTNPWFQECGPRVVRNNEILALDTDLIGVYGLCCDISRTWFLGDAAPRPDMIEDYRLAREHIEANMALLKPGMNFDEITHQAHVLPDIYQKQKYSCLMHGVGLCDEWPMITYPGEWREGAFDHVLEPGMMICVEALVSREDGDFSIKLEDQVLITEDGFQNLTNYPFDAHLMGN